MLTAFPTLTETEFVEACRCFEHKCFARLDGTNWLSVKWDTDGALHVKQLYLCTAQGEGEILEKYEKADAWTNTQADEMEDEFTLKRHEGNELSRVAVDFSITLSPTYQVPVLWFVIVETPGNGPQGIDAVYQYIVPRSCRAQLKETGVMGGISMAHHPVSDIPAFFIHPCNTQEGLLPHQSGQEISPYGYLLLWLGLVGPSVGLYMPSQLVAAD